MKKSLVFPMAVLFLMSCASARKDSDADTLIESAIMEKPDSPQQIQALQALMAKGHAVEVHNPIWMQGCSFLESKSSTEDLEGEKDAQLVQVDGIHYVFSGHADGKATLSLLCVRSYPDGKLRFVKLAEASW
jgi:hypothetical protein